MEEMIQEKVVQKENELNATYDERIRNYEERYVLQLLTVIYKAYMPLPSASKTSSAKSH